MRNSLNYLLYLYFAFLCIGCFKSKMPDYIEGWEPIVAVPLINADFNASDLMEYANPDSTSVAFDENGNLAMTYRTSFTKTAEELFTLDENQVEAIKIFNSTETQALSAGASFVESTTLNLSIPNNNTNLYFYESVFLSGQLEVELYNSQRDNFEGKIQFLNLFQPNGQPFEINMTAEVSTFGTATFFFGDLSGCRLVSTDGFPTLIGQLDMEFSDNPTATTSPGNYMQFKMRLKEPKYNWLKADFGQTELINERDTINLPLFDDFLEGEIQLEKANLTVEATNSFGINFWLDLTNIQSYNRHTHNYGQYAQPLTLDVQKPNFLGAPASISQNAYDISGTDLLSITPHEIYMDLKLATNSGGGSAANPDFITHESALQLDVKVEVPLSVYATDIIIKNTSEVSLPQEDMDQNVDQIVLKLGVGNTFPLYADLQIVFLDEDYNALDSLFAAPKEIFPSPTYYQSGVFHSEGQAYTEIVLNQTRAERILPAKYTVLRAKLNTTNNASAQYIQLHASQLLEISVGARVHFKPTRIDL